MFPKWRRRKKEENPNPSVQTLVTVPRVSKGEVLIDFYPVSPPFAYAAIVRRGPRGRYEYKVLEPPLTAEDKRAIEEIKSLVSRTVRVDLKTLREKSPEQVLEEEVKRVVKKYRVKVKREAWDKILYYVKRDMLGYGKIDVLMKDEHIEDISCDGVGVPVFVWHSRYESMPTNIVFNAVSYTHLTLPTILLV